MVSITTEVEVYLDDFEDDELIGELQDRGYFISKKLSEIPDTQNLYDAWVYKNGNFENLFREFCKATIGRSF